MAKAKRDRAVSAWKKAEEARSDAVRDWDEARVERDKALASVNSLRTAHAEELRRAEENIFFARKDGRKDAV